MATKRLLAPFSFSKRDVIHNFWRLSLLSFSYRSYHHTFPFDYRIAEIGFQTFNPAKWFIDMCSWIGLASNLKVASPYLIQKTKERVASTKSNDSNFYLHDHPYVDPHIFCDEEETDDGGRGL